MLDVCTLLEVCLNLCLRSACSIDEAFFLVENFLGLLYSSAELAGFLNCQISD
jgi:hypothetical protein